MIPALALAFASGFIALSYEILWYRAYSFVTGGAASTFGFLLGAYLLGLALGSLGVRTLCGEGDREKVRQLKWLFRLSLAATLSGYLVVPLLGQLAIRGGSGLASLLLVTVAAAGLGTLFPLTSHLGVPPDERAGRRISYVYLANILGSTLGSLLTGFVLMDRFSLAQVHVFLLFLGIAVSAFILVLGVRSAGGAAALVVSGALAVVGGGAPFAEIYEKLQGKVDYRPGRRFAHVVETRSGVITVNEAGQIFGGGIYDGAFNTDLRDDKNSILRCYALAGLRESPKDVLMIGLSSGSWATVVANNPAVERLTIVEINPGYLQLIPKYSAVAGLLSNPKVRIEIDDGRRWLVRNKDRRFDAIVANATFHWRSNASNLLSADFLRLIRSRLKEGGYYYYNTTESVRVLKTGCAVFPHALKIGGFLAVSDAPLAIDLDRLRDKLFDYPRAGGGGAGPDPAGGREDDGGSAAAAEGDAAAARGGARAAARRAAAGHRRQHGDRVGRGSVNALWVSGKRVTIRGLREPELRNFPGPRGYYGEERGSPLLTEDQAWRARKKSRASESVSPSGR